MDQDQLRAIQAMMVFLPIFILIGMAIVVIPYWMIWKKAGFSPWFSLLMFVPLVGIVMLYVLAFSDWKVAPVAPTAPGYGYPPSSLPPRV